MATGAACHERTRQCEGQQDRYPAMPRGGMLGGLTADGGTLLGQSGFFCAVWPFMVTYRCGPLASAQEVIVGNLGLICHERPPRLG